MRTKVVGWDQSREDGLAVEGVWCAIKRCKHG